MSISKFTASNAIGKGKPDASFESARIAKEAIEKFGKEKVVDGTLGVLKDDSGNFATLPSVEKEYRSIPAIELMDYAPIEGLQDFLNGAIKYVFQGNQPQNTYAKAVATLGGTGAIHHMIVNYVEQDQKFLIPNWHWGPYREMATENLRKWELYEMFDETGKFSLESIKTKTLELLKIQDSVMVIFNTPAHNPSGYSMTNEDWNEILEFFKECVSEKDKNIIILLDIAYIDYAGESNEVREFMNIFTSLPDNILTAIAFSMSKSFLVYGMRSGALIGLSSNEDIVEEFYNVNKFSNRATWSNGVRGCQKLLANIMNNEILFNEIEEERKLFSIMLKKRADIFLEEAEEVGLKVLPYKSGFFITVPTDDSVGVAKKLVEDNIFVIPIAKGVRFAISAVPTSKIRGLATKTKKILLMH